mmetsp:Transcript_66904/g.118759  ORF Transcript_66904/g.118759 Transcript_66904/m.118759 type:complete len:235 (+) Transcript_66904:3362-4066(+)
MQLGPISGLRSSIAHDGACAGRQLRAIVGGGRLHCGAQAVVQGDSVSCLSRNGRAGGGAEGSNDAEAAAPGMGSVLRMLAQGKQRLEGGGIQEARQAALNGSDTDQHLQQPPLELRRGLREEGQERVDAPNLGKLHAVRLRELVQTQKLGRCVPEQAGGPWALHVCHQLRGSPFPGEGLEGRLLYILLECCQGVGGGPAVRWAGAEDLKQGKERARTGQLHGPPKPGEVAQGLA